MSFLLNLQKAKNKKIIIHRSNKRIIRPLEKKSGKEDIVPGCIEMSNANILNVP
ncbi:unnamed protein product [marine sediment metagenome]|uniref:Uncharacterized protein n=1 Tax=marine sediment metagenome TaxID=412755 RepID=X1T7Z0_9ZZZZ